MLKVAWDDTPPVCCAHPDTRIGRCCAHPYDGMDKDGGCAIRSTIGALPRRRKLPDLRGYLAQNPVP